MNNSEDLRAGGDASGGLKDPIRAPGAGGLRVLVVAANASAKWGGEAVLPLHVFRGLRAAGHEAWLCVGVETKAELDELLGADAQRVLYVDDADRHMVYRRIEEHVPKWLGNNPLYFLSVLVSQFEQRKTVLQVVKDLGIDLVHQPTPVSPKVPSFLADLPVPLIIGPMNGGLEYPPGFRFLEAWPIRAIRALRRLSAGMLNSVFDGKATAECLLVANERTRRALPVGVRGRVVELVENGVDAELWIREFEGREAEKASRADGEERPFKLIFLGRLERWKGAEWLVEAMVGVRRRVNCELLVVGDFRDERVRLEALVGRLGLESGVELLGWQSQARCAELLRAADTLVLPSVYEAGGAVVLEAMASGKAVIAVDWGGPADYLDPECGILIPPSDPAGLVKALEEAIVALATDRTRCAQMGRTGREKVLARFTWSKKLESLVEIYRGVLQDGET